MADLRRYYSGQAIKVGSMKAFFIVIFLIASLTACGGGGSNAGTCSGSDEVCGRLVTNRVVSSYPSVDLASITCPQILALFNGDKAAAFAAAQYYLSLGAVRLNGDPQSDKTACDKYIQ
jgi:hypothetical protein